MSSFSKQIGALPFILDEDGPKFLLITSRRSKRWILPKGWPKEGVDDHELAKLEAFEEAGIGGKIGIEALGHFTETRNNSDQEESYQLRIWVFPFLVTYHYIDWPEKGQRKHTWLSSSQAANLIENKELAEIISIFDPTHFPLA